ncbi:MAG: hypothetical protein IPG24_03155 [Leptospiraceae bacterium]|nr:hypothetical protein [Leptospiraceae bacterium]
MKRLTFLAILLFAFISLSAGELRVAVVGEPEELRLKVEAALFHSLLQSDCVKQKKRRAEWKGKWPARCVR